jgi:Trk-type K+ transport system membrane component
MRVRVTARVNALAASWRGLIAEARENRFLGRELAVIWLAWFLVLCVEKFTPSGEGAEGNAIFSSLFELCSAYGNVGLSIGSPNKTNASFSADWSWWSQVVLMLVMVTGRTRELPNAVDGALELANGQVQLLQLEKQLLYMRLRCAFSLHS